MIASKGTIQFGKPSSSPKDKLQIAIKANEIIAYIVAANLKYNDRSGRNAADEASYGNIYKKKVIIDASSSPALGGLKDLLDFLYGTYNNNLKEIQPNLVFRSLTPVENKRKIRFDLGLKNSTDVLDYRVISFDMKPYPDSLQNANTVSVFAAARLRDPISQTIGSLLGDKKQTVIVGGPGVDPGNIMVHTAETAKKHGSRIGFITADYLFKRQKSLSVKPDFILVAKTIYERTCLMYELGHLVIVLPGGVAVVEEVLTTIACNLRQEILGKRKKPIVLWNESGHWDSLYSWLKILGIESEVRTVTTKEKLLKYLT